MLLKKESLTIENTIYKFIEDKKKDRLSYRSIQVYSQVLLLFSRYLEEVRNITTIDEINRDTIEGYVEFTLNRKINSYTATTDKEQINRLSKSIKNKGVSVKTMNNYLRVIKNYLNWLYEAEYIDTVPKISLLRETRTPKDNLSLREFKILLSVIDRAKFHGKRDYIIIKLLMDTGMRIGETLKLLQEDIDINKNTIYIRKEITKTNKPRAVFFSNTLAKELKNYIQYKCIFTDTNILFPSSRQYKFMTVENFERNFRRYVRLANIDKHITPHCLRNQFGREYLVNGGSLFQLSKLLGHQSTNVTSMCYADLNIEDLRKSYISPLDNMK